MILSAAHWTLVHEGAWPSLLEGEVHIWRLNLALAPGRLAGLGAALEAGESERADRFVFSKDRDRFVAARGLLREVLAGYTGLGPNRIRFAYGANGKPRWEAPSPGSAALDFNLSHSSALALLAVSRGGPVGIDVEEVRPGYADEGIAERFFSPGEAASLRAIASGRRDESFFRVWTRKEAVVKALGEGLASSLTRFSVATDPDAVASRPTGEASLAALREWVLHDLSPMTGYVGALAVRKASPKLRRFELAADSPGPQAGRRSTISRPIANAEVAAGEGALST